MDPRFGDILRDKPELIWPIPEWMLPADAAKSLKKAENPAIVEVAGRDSFAAAVRAVDELPIDAVLPTIAYTGTEFGDWEVVFGKTGFLKKLLAEKAPGVAVYGPVVLGSAGLWRIINGRYVSALFERYGFYTPCIGCHVYFHAIRVSLAKKTGCNFVIAGERESHDGRIKLNQTGPALDTYVNFLARFGVELVLPLRHVASGAEIEELVGGDWEEEADQLDCVLSNNYRDKSGDLSYDENAIENYLAEFAVPVAERAVNKYLAGETPDYSKLAGGLL
ncbi:MAG: hypothetical protein JSW52_07170 [Candidatus Coatesbacteria bacterium]|nr:MAG: hypothetical protein JSW52_07170 [Candidatus Coatesbacteria bacterium]